MAAKGSWVELNLESITSVAKSLLAPENLKDITPEQEAEVKGIYQKLLAVQLEVVTGVRSPK